jgi:hypothetical protein
MECGLQADNACRSRNMGDSQFDLRSAQKHLLICRHPKSFDASHIPPNAEMGLFWQCEHSLFRGSSQPFIAYSWHGRDERWTVHRLQRRRCTAPLLVLRFGRWHRGLITRRNAYDDGGAPDHACQRVPCITPGTCERDKGERSITGAHHLACSWLPDAGRHDDGRDVPAPISTKRSNITLVGYGLRHGHRSLPA